MTEEAISNSGNSLNLANAAGVNNNFGGTENTENTENNVSRETNGTNEINGTNGINNNEDEWLIDEGIPGKGVIPPWFKKDTYKTIFGQAKSAGDMRKMLGARTGAPEEYSLDLKELGKDYENLELDKEDALLQEFTKFAKNQKLNQEGFNEVLKMFIDYSNLQSNREDQELEQFQKAELNILGGPEEAKMKIQEMTQWFKQNFPDYDPTDLHDMMYFAKGFEIIKAFRDKIGFSHVPTTNDYSTPAISKDELRKMLTDDRYMSDPDYQKRVNNEYERVYGNS